MVNDKQQKADIEDAVSDPAGRDGSADEVGKDTNAAAKPVDEPAAVAGQSGDSAGLDHPAGDPAAGDPAADAAESAEEAVEDITEAELTLEHLQEEMAAAKDAALRAHAEAQNARRRAEQDV